MVQTEVSHLTLSPSLRPSQPLTVSSSQSHSITVSPSHYFTLSPSHYFTLSPSHYFTFSPSHPATTRTSTSSVTVLHLSTFPPLTTIRIIDSQPAWNSASEGTMSSSASLAPTVAEFSASL